MWTAIGALLFAGLAQSGATPWSVTPSSNGSCTMRTVVDAGGHVRDLRFVMDKFGKITIALRRSDWNIRPRSLASVSLWLGKPNGDAESTYWFSLKDDATGLEGESSDAFLDRLAAADSLTVREAALKIDETIDTKGAAAAVQRLRACAG